MLLILLGTQILLELTVEVAYRPEYDHLDSAPAKAFVDEFGSEVNSLIIIFVICSVQFRSVDVRDKTQDLSRAMCLIFHSIGNEIVVTVSSETLRKHLEMMFTYKFPPIAYN